MIAVYVAHHRWLDFDYGPNKLYKVGFTTNTGRRLSDSAYVTCFVGSWRYVYLQEVDTESDAEELESAVLARLNRVGDRELVNNTLDEIESVIRACAKPRQIQVNARPNFKLRYYQEEAVCAIRAELAANGRAILNMACRSGKTLVAYNCISEGWAAYFVPNVLLSAQIEKKLTEYGAENVINVNGTTHNTSANISKLMQTNLRGIVICTYQSSAIIATNMFNFCIFDEAHGMHHYISDLVRKPHFKNHIFMTATPTKQMLDRPDIFGKISYTYTLNSAIKDGYVSDYQNIELTGILSEQIQYASSQVNKMLVFCRDIAQIKQLESELKSNCIAIHSKVSSVELLLDKFITDSSKTILLSCKQFQEGIEIPQLDSIFFTYIKHSEIDITQCICRPLTLHETKKEKAKIFIFKDEHII